MTLTGSPAPDFTLPRDGGGSVTLSQQRPRNVVLYFYPRDNTPGCTWQAVDFTKHLDEFTALDTVVIGVSRDPVARHDKFVKKHDLGIILASDESGETCKHYGVWGKKLVFGLPQIGLQRSTFLIDGDGLVRREWRKVKVRNHVEAVLEAVRDSRA